MDNTKFTKQFASSSDTLYMGASVILSLFPLTAPIGAMGSLSLMAWQKEQQQKFIDEVQQKLETIDETKVDCDFLETGEFKELALQAVEAASKTASDLKRQFLARALVNSIVLPTSKVNGKQSILRTLSQMSDEEIRALSAVAKESERLSVPFDAVGLHQERIASHLNWDVQEVLVACDGLLQLGLLYAPMVKPAPNANPNSFSQPRPTLFTPPDQPDEYFWRVTALGYKVMDFCLGQRFEPEPKDPFSFHAF